MYTFLVLGPLASHENEAVELHSGTDNRHPFEALLEDDVDVAMHGRRVRVGDPPEVKPVSVDLVVGQKNDSIREIDTKRAISFLMQLTSNALVAAYADEGWTPPLGHGRNKKAEVLLGKGHVGVEVILGDEVER